MKWIIGLIISLTLLTGTADEVVPVSYFPVIELPVVSKTELHCLALNIHRESSGEPFKGKLVVGQVVLNRTRNSSFPGTICGVVKQRGQFSWVVGIKHFERQAVPEEIKQLAYDIMTGVYPDISKGALYFHNSSAERFKRRFLFKIGEHFFYA